MSPCKGQLVGRLKADVLAAVRRERHLLSEVVVEVVVELVSALVSPAAKDVYVVATLAACLHEAVGTHLPAVGLRFQELHRRVRVSLAAGESEGVVGREAVYELEGMARHHHRVAGYSVYAHGVVCRELAVVFLVVQSAVQTASDASVRTEHISLAVQLHRDAVGMHVVSHASVERYCQVVTAVHAAALYEP